MKIYMLNPPFAPRFGRSARWQAAGRAGCLYYPLWLAYATGVVEERYKKVRLVDAVAWNWSREDVTEDVKKFKPDLAVVDSSFPSLTNDIEVARAIKDNIELVKTVLVGPPAAQFPDEILKNDAMDIVARYEYDFTIRDIAKAIEENGNLKSIKGISYKENGNILHNPNRAFISSEELDKIPFVSEVYKKHLNIRDYLLNQTLYPEVQIFTGRGCPNQCTFCSWPETLMGRKYRVRSVGNVVDELEWIQENLPVVKEVFLEDDTFTINKKRIREFSEEVKRRRLDITWSCNARANLDYETMKAMKEAGCRLLDVGYESGSDEILRNIKKGITTEEMRRFTRDAKKAGLMILGDFVFGFTGETKETAEETIKFIKELKPNILQVAIPMPIPGTGFYEWVKEKGYLLVDSLEEALDENKFQKCIVSYPEFTNRDIEEYVDRAYKEYYLTPFYVPIAMKNVLRRNGLHELKGMVVSAKAFSRYIRREK